MKYKLFLHPRRPKIPKDRIQKILNDLKVSWSDKNPDIAIIVGGDGTFGYYARRLKIPMLFVGVSDANLLGSKARLAELFLEDLPRAILKLQKGEYYLDARRLIKVYTEEINELVFTDLYLERGDFGGCLRYTLTVKPGTKKRESFTDHCIGNGVIVSTSIGASGYFSYPQKLIFKKGPQTLKFGPDQIGICHISPSFLDRKTSPNNVGKSVKWKVQFTVPIGSIVEIRLLRPKKAFLYGISKSSKGIEINNTETVHIRASHQVAKIIRLIK